MKKVMIGILILIPVLILVIVAAISNFLKIAAWIAVDDISVVYKNTSQEAESIDIEFSGTPVRGSFDEFVSVKVMPDYANRYSIEWRISDVEFMDERYQQEYEKYEKELEEYNRYLSNLGNYNNQIARLEAEIANAEKQLEKDIADVQASSLTSVAKREKIEELQEAFDELKVEKESQIAEYTAKKNALVKPEVRYVAHAAMLVDDNGNEVTSNTSSKFVINSYCRFNLTVQVENASRTLSVIVKGYNVQDISIINGDGETQSTIGVGEKLRVNAKYTPISSIVTETRWHSDNPSVASVDQNGVITAISAGVAKITVEANRYDDKDEFVTSEEYTVSVEAGVSKFGSEFSTSKSSFTLDEIGVKLSDVLRNAEDTDYDCEGCIITPNVTGNGGIVTLVDDSVARIVTKNGTLTIYRCDETDILIENAEVYSATAGYVFEVSELTLKLRAVWADVLKEGVPDGVVWETSDEKIATVANNGEVKAIESGLVDITATKDGKTSKLMLNVQIKIASMTLRTSDESFKVGLARETVFAAEKYRFDVSVSNEKVANSMLIEIIDAPKRTDFASESEYIKQLAAFYNAYNYEIIEGEDYAYFSENGGEPNRLIFIPSALEGKGKQSIKVKVSAKYPKYEGDYRFTSKDVEIKVIYGVEVNNIAEFRKASEDQKTYAYADGNLQDSEIAWEHVNTEEGKYDVYRYCNAVYSLRTYGICVMGDLRYEDELNPDGSFVEIRDSNNVKIYGDVYGNNHLLSAARNQVYDVQSMLWIAWSNVTVSNLTIRANKMDKDGTLSSDETNGLKGECLQVFTETDYAKYRVTGVRIEFCVLENARRAGQSYNADFTMDGVVVRNIDSVAFYIPARMTTYDEDGVNVTYADFSRVTMNNCVYANCISPIGSYSYERYSVVADSSNGRTYYGRFIENDLAANAEYFMTHFYNEGVNTQIRQTGFIDIYNWQNVSVANIIDTGDSETNKLIGLFAGDIFRYTDEFGRCRYIDENNECYIHMGILSTGISFGEGIMDEPIYLDATFEDARMVSAPIRTQDLPSYHPNLSAAATAALPVIRGMELRFYGYDVNKLSKNDILPNSVFELNSSSIARLHGESL